MPSIDQTRADRVEVTNILSESFARTLPADEEDRLDPITPEKVDDMKFPLAWLQEIHWELYDGTFGPNTLLKEVEYSTSTCDECGGEGWNDHRGDVVCDECGMVLSDTPLAMPYDPESGRCNGNTGQRGRYVFFGDTATPAMNQNTVDAAPDEPNVQ